MRQHNTLKPVARAKTATGCSVTITGTFGHFSLNGCAKHWENRYFLKFANQNMAKSTGYSNTAARGLEHRVEEHALAEVVLECYYNRRNIKQI